MSSGYTYDSGTGVLDKASIREYTIQSLAKVSDRENATWVGIGDIDDFKDINDSYGHAYGDKVLRLVADTFRRHLGGWGEIGRFGGDEFFFCINDADEETVRNIFRLSFSSASTMPTRRPCGISSAFPGWKSGRRLHRRWLEMSASR